MPSVEPLPILYSFRRCPYAIRARLALNYADVAVEHREVLLRDKPAEMLALSPKGTVPVLQLADGRVLDESIDIMRWALARQDPDGWLDADASVTADLIEENDGPFKQALDRYKYFERFPEAPRATYRAGGERFLIKLEARLQRQTGGLMAEVPRLADMAIFPFIRQFAGADATWFGQAPYPLLRAWLNRHLASELFLGVMEKRPQWIAPT